MQKVVFVAAYRFLCCALTLSATSYSIALRWHAPTFRLSNFFSYFTQLSSLYAAAVLAAGLWLATRPPSRRYESARGAVVLYMAIAGIVYALLLADVDTLHHATPHYTNWVLHRIMPIAVFIDWLYVAPRVRIDWSHLARWLAFPLAYLGYTLVRGALVDWYPYPFVDPRAHGYLIVAAYSGAIAAGSIGFAALIVLLGNWAGAPAPQTERA
ncbi:Pr6Pr family membrane protein [Burkholderia oklahomensis]|uniref:Pr6Pr family membrane protein n=1 Tax=Burkholderia oklahomensis TaxID=342113 RepID=UPI002654FB8B|nr:Pr6Pr family membrane protein [Burkholderia oklahomensis]MDN7672619.1 Pr6Pr family membrane protein [Burkholderia oklahomensis]